MKIMIVAVSRDSREIVAMDDLLIGVMDGLRRLGRDSSEMLLFAGMYDNKVDVGDFFCGDKNSGSCYKDGYSYIGRCRGGQVCF